MAHEHHEHEQAATATAVIHAGMSMDAMVRDMRDRILVAVNALALKRLPLPLR